MEITRLQCYQIIEKHLDAAYREAHEAVGKKVDDEALPSQGGELLIALHENLYNVVNCGGNFAGHGEGRP